MQIYDSNDTLILEVEVDDSSYRHRVICGEHNLTLKYSLAVHVELPIGAYCTYQGQRYTLMLPEQFIMHHTRNFEYTVIMEAEQAKAQLWMFRNPIDGRLKFPLTAKPHEHLAMLIENMNRRDSGWSVGGCIEGAERLVCYDHDNCWNALCKMAQEFNTEFEIVGKSITLGKLEKFKNNPLPLSYHDGLKPGVERLNGEDSAPIEILFIQGGSRNIDLSEYGNSTLLLPKEQQISFDGTYFEDEVGYNSTNARRYVVSQDGMSVQRYDKQLSSMAEGSIDLSNIYPSRVGAVTSVITVDASKNFYDIVDTSIDFNYEDYLIPGETMTIVFQSGQLAGREFDVKYKNDGKCFEIVPQEIDGLMMPCTNFLPAVDDTYAVFGCMLPDEYICDNVKKEGAEWEMFREAVRYLYDHEDIRVVYNGDLDGIWTKSDWVNIGGKIVLGGYILFSDERFQVTGVPVRITDIKDYVNKPHSPIVELSNQTVSIGLSGTIRKLESEAVAYEDHQQRIEQYTKRRWRDAKETMDMLNDLIEAGFDNFTEGINPITVQTMQMLVGDESLQFRFVNQKVAPIIAVDPGIIYSRINKKLVVAQTNILQHMTLGISTISSNHSPSDYKFWDLPTYDSAVLVDPAKKYYLYAKVVRLGSSGAWVMSETPIAMEGVNGYYHFLVGILNSEYEGERSFVTLYGFTEVLPGRITVDKIQDPNATTVFDLTTGTITGKITIQSGSSGLTNLSEWQAQATLINNIQQQVDGKIETFYQTTNPANSWTTDAVRAAHVGDIWYNNTTQLVYRYQGPPYDWAALTDADAMQAKTIAEGKNTVFLTQPSNYKTGDLWVLQSPTTVNGTLYNAGEVLTATSNGTTYNAAHWTKKVYYDHTKTVIDGGIVTSGTIQLAGDNNNILAGITGNGTASTSIRIWAGSTYENRATAPFRVTQAGTMYATDAIIEGQVTATSGSIGGFTITNGWLKSDSNATINNDVGYIQMGSPTGTYEMTFGRNLQPKTIATIYNGSIGENPSTFSYDKSTLICRIRNNNNASASGVLLPKVNVALDINVSANPLTGTNYGRAIAINAIGDIVDYGRQLFWNKVYYTTSTETLTEYYSAVVAQPSSAITLTLPDLSGTSAFYFGDGDGYTYKGLFTIRIIASRWATATTTITGTSSCPLINQYNGSNISVSMTAGQVFDFCYYNGSWYCHKSASV